MIDHKEFAAYWCDYYFQSQENGSTVVLVVGIVFAILTAVFGVIYLSGRLNKTDDIHITE